MISAVFLLSTAVLATALPAQQGCLFDGHMYNAGENIHVEHCLATIPCLGNNVLGDIVLLGGVCSDKRSAIDGQTGCYYDGTNYNMGETIVMKGCVGAMTCLGNNNLGPITSLFGNCPSNPVKRTVDGQSGCLFDGRVYSHGDKIIIPHCEGEMTCLGHNNYSPLISYGGVCP